MKRVRLRTLILATILFSLTLYSGRAMAGVTGTLAGTVIDQKTNEPLPGANIVIKGTMMGTMADMQGFFLINNIPAGTYSVTASMMGYTSVTNEGVTILVDLRTTLEFRLAPTVLDLCGILYEEEDFTGRSMASLIDEPHVVPEAVPIVSTGLLYFEDRISVIFDGAKYMRNLVNGQVEVYDLETDPSERMSLAASRPDATARAEAILARHVAASNTLRERMGITAAGAGEIDPDRARQLRDLGYVW